MKCRQDFVTNSSSSSYIFGSVNGNDFSCEILYRHLYIWVIELVNLVKDIDAILNIKDNDVFSKLNDVRNMYLKLYEKTVYNEEYCDLYDKIDTMRNYFDGLSFMGFINNELLMRKVSIDIVDFMDFYLNEHNELNRLQSFLLNKSYNEYLNSENKSFKFTIIDFKDNKHNDKFDVEEIVSWYCYNDIEDDEYFNENENNYNDLAHKYLGEVAIFSSEGYIPRILMRLFENNSNYFCHHMG